MRWLVDLIWLILVVLMSPVLVPRLLQRRWHRTDWRGRRGWVDQPAPEGTPHILLHAVSVGEVNAIRTLVPLLRSRGCGVTVSVTTDTGTEQARARFGSDVRIVRYPLDLSCWTTRFLDRIQPHAIGFVELELWPNFTEACARRGIPMLVVGGRLSERSLRRYRLIRWFVRPMFRRLRAVHATDSAIAERFIRLGAPATAMRVEGSLKWDNTAVGNRPPEADALAMAMGIDRNRPLIVVGSSAPEEHVAIRDAVPLGCQVLVAPRRPEWWDDAAQVFEGCARRSLDAHGSDTDRFLLDTIGELSAAYALADLVIIGRSFGDRHGSDPVEPAGMGIPVLCGPAMSDFQQAMDVLIQAAAIKSTTLDQLASDVATLLAEPTERRTLGARAQAAIREQQGASEAAADALIQAAKSACC